MVQHSVDMNGHKFKTEYVGLESGFSAGLSRTAVVLELAHSSADRALVRAAIDALWYYCDLNPRALESLKFACGQSNPLPAVLREVLHVPLSRAHNASAFIVGWARRVSARVELLSSTGEDPHLMALRDRIEQAMVDLNHAVSGTPLHRANASIDASSLATLYRLSLSRRCVRSSHTPQTSLHSVICGARMCSVCPSKPYTRCTQTYQRKR